jgi:COMPASS component SWD1
MSASRDWNVIIWDLKTGDRRTTVRFESPITSAALHPRNSNILAVTLQNQAETVLVDRRPDGGRWELCLDVKLDNAEIPKGGRKAEYATVVRFTPRGDLIYVASSLGSIFVFNARSKEVGRGWPLYVD